MAIEWPESADLERLLDVTDTEKWDGDMSDLVAQGIRAVRSDCGLADDDNPATEGQRQAALRFAELIRTNGPESSENFHRDGRYQGLLYGTRTRFGIG